MNQRTPLPTTLVQGCRPWCTNHANGSPANTWPLPEDQICQTSISDPAFGAIGLGHSVADGTIISLHNVRLELTPDEATRLLLGLAAAITTSRGGRAVS